MLGVRTYPLRKADERGINEQFTFDTWDGLRKAATERALRDTEGAECVLIYRGSVSAEH